MSLEATRVALKAKVADKGRLRPHEIIRKKMPDGTGSLQDLPVRDIAGADDEAADSSYCLAIDRVTAAFGKRRGCCAWRGHPQGERDRELRHLPRRGAAPLVQRGSSWWQRVR